MNKCADQQSVSYPKNAGHLLWHTEQMTENTADQNRSADQRRNQKTVSSHQQQLVDRTKSAATKI
jgi:hypothetical protein